MLFYIRQLFSVFYFILWQRFLHFFSIFLLMSSDGWKYDSSWVQKNQIFFLFFFPFLNPCQLSSSFLLLPDLSDQHSTVMPVAGLSTYYHCCLQEGFLRTELALCIALCPCILSSVWLHVVSYTAPSKRAVSCATAVGEKFTIWSLQVPAPSVSILLPWWSSFRTAASTPLGSKRTFFLKF